MNPARLTEALQQVLSAPHYAHIRDLARNLATDLAPLIEPEPVPNEAGLRCFVYECHGYITGAHAVIVARDQAAADSIFAERFRELLRSKVRADLTGAIEVREASLNAPNVVHSHDGDM